MSRITVVGASGYLGGRIGLQLQQQGNEVIAAFRNPPCDPERNLDALSDTVQGDVTDKSFIDAIVETKPQALVYLVSLNHHATEQSYQHSINVNVAPLMDLARRLADQSGFQRLIFMSTLQVYGKASPNKTFIETDRIEPANMYGWTHAACEDGLLLLQRSHNLSSTSLRLSNGYGAPAFPSCDCWWLVLNDFCRSAIREGKIQLKSDGSPQRDFIHVSNIAGVISEVVTQRGEVPQIMNLASGESLSMLELAHLVAHVLEVDFDKHVPVILPDGKISPIANPPHNRIRISTETLLGLIPGWETCSLKSGIKETLQYITKYDI